MEGDVFMESKLRNVRKKLLTVVMSCLMLVGMMPATMQAFAEGASDVATTHQVKFVTTPQDSQITVNDSENKEVDPSKDNKHIYELKTGTYTYSVFSKGYKPIADKSFKVEEDQEIKVELLKEEPTNKKPGLLMNRNSRGPAKSGTEHNNVITKTEFFHDAGGPLQVGDIVVKWERIKIQMDFELPDNTVHQGDTTVISLPAQLKFGDNSGFPVKDASGNVVANAVINESAKTVTLTYTDYPQNHSGVKGKLFFFARINHEEYDNEQDIPITINVGSTVIPGPTVHFEGVPDKEPKTFDKGSWKWQDRKFSYSVNINQKKQVIKNVVITDEQQNKGVTIDKDSFRIYKGKWYLKNHSWKLDETAANLVTSQFIDKVVWKYNEDGKIIGFTLPIGDIGADDGYMIRYDSDVSYLPVNGECFFNDATMTGDEIEHLKVHSGLNYAIGGGIAEGYVFTIKVVKKDDSTPAKPVKGAKFKFVRDSNGADLGVHETDDNGEIQLKNLLRDTYTITEVSVPNGYVLDKTPKKVNPADFGEDKIALVSVTNKKIPVIDISGEKTWSDGDNQDGKRPSSITVNLLADGKEIKEQTVTPDSDGKWKYSFKGLPECDKDGKKIVYTVTEDSVDEYNAEIDGYNIKNSYTPKKTSVTATKRWNDNNNQDGKRPNSVKVQLYGDGNKVGAEVELNKGNNWTTTWNDLPEKKAGKTIVYTVEEVGTVEGYTSTVNNQNIGNIIICNKHTPEKTEVAGEKTWEDANNQDGKRPESITVNLLADGKKVAEKTVTKDDAWKYEFKDLPKYKDGKEIVYTVTENTVVGYSTGIKGHDITNSYTPGETSVTVTKHWNDSNDKDGIRPGSIKVQLFGDGNKVGDEVELNEKNNWTTTWNKLPQKKSGKDITYTVKEVGSISGYTTTVDDKNHGDIIITNTHTPKEISGVKTGDNTNLMLFIFLMFTSSAVLGTILVRRKRKIQ